MMLFSSILVAYDGSALSKKALAKAVEMVKDSPDPAARLEVIHIHHDVMVLPGTAYAIDTNVSADVIEEAKSLIPASVKASFTVGQGQPAFAILRHAEESGSDLIVMGSRGLGAIREFFLGSVSHNVVQQAKVPVLIVK